MTYKGHSIERGEIVRIRPGSGGRKGTYNIVAPSGEVVDFVYYTVGNFADRSYALIQAKRKINRLVDKAN